LLITKQGYDIQDAQETVCGMEFEAGEARKEDIFGLPSESANRAAEHARGALDLSHRGTRHKAFPLQAVSLSALFTEYAMNAALT
jgi:hypothetical protein